jgi:putative redox protein
MKVSVKWEGAATFLGETEGGHAIIMDGPPDAGGRNLGPRPMETVLLGTAACSSFHVVHILRRARQKITGCSVEVNSQRAPTDPKVFERIQFHYLIRGWNLRREFIQRAIDLSAAKYCSASIMLGKHATMEFSFDVIDEESAPSQQVGCTSHG